MDFEPRERVFRKSDDTSGLPDSRDCQIGRRSIITSVEFWRKECVFRKFDDTFSSQIPEITRAHGDVSSLLWISSREGVFSANLMILCVYEFQKIPDYAAMYHHFCGFQPERACFPQI